MILSSTAAIAGLIAYKYIILYPLVLLEGAVATLMAGFLVSIGQLNFWVAYIIVNLGELTGDVIYYVIGYQGRETFIVRYGRYFGLTMERIQKLDDHFKTSSTKALLIGKFTHVFSIFFLTAAGIARMPFKKFMLVNFAASLVKSLIMLTIGYYTGQAYLIISQYLDYASLLFVGLPLLVIFIFYLIKYFKK